MRGVLLLAFVVSSLVCLSMCAEPLTDEQWLTSTDDVQTLANAALRELKRSSSIHLYDDIALVSIVEHKKTIAGYSRSLYLRLRIRSMHFKSKKAEELLSVLVLRHNQNGKYSFAIPSYPEMVQSFVEKQEEVWSDKHREERDKHFKELEETLSSDAFENQSFAE